MATIYKKTATKANDGKIYAFGRRSELNGRPTSEGGYILFVAKASYNGQKRGGIDRRFVVVEQDMTYEDVVSLMNVKCGYKAFEI